MATKLSYQSLLYGNTSNITNSFGVGKGYLSIIQNIINIKYSNVDFVSPNYAPTWMNMDGSQNKVYSGGWNLGLPLNQNAADAACSMGTTTWTFSHPEYLNISYAPNPPINPSGSISSVYLGTPNPSPFAFVILTPVAGAGGGGTTNQCTMQCSTVVDGQAVVSPLITMSIDNSPIPVLTGFTPTSGGVGTPVTLNGNYFNAYAPNPTIKFNGVSTPINQILPTQITVNAPTSTTGKITVEYPNQSLILYSSIPFTYLPITITVSDSVIPNTSISNHQYSTNGNTWSSLGSSLVINGGTSVWFRATFNNNTGMVKQYSILPPTCSVNVGSNSAQTLTTPCSNVSSSSYTVNFIIKN